MPSLDPVFIGVDLGGTKIAAAAVRAGKVLESERKKTQAHKGPDVVIERIEAVVREIFKKMDAQASDFQAVCIGAPGAVDAEAGVVRNAPNLGWKNLRIGDRLSKRLGLPVLLDNDVNIGVVGEHAHGAGRGARHVAGIFVGTGIGGALIVDGKPHAGFRGAAGEVGHMILHPKGRRCPCGREGCVEAYASKTSMHAMIREGVKQGRKSIVPDLMRKKGKDRLSSSVVAEALKEKDALMQEAVETSQYYLGLLAANLVNSFDPEVVVFGGGIVERLGKSFIEPIARTARKHFLQQQDAKRIRIVPGQLGDDAGPIGAAIIAERRLNGDG